MTWPSLFQSVTRVTKLSVPGVSSKCSLLVQPSFCWSTRWTYLQYLLIVSASGGVCILQQVVVAVVHSLHISHSVRSHHWKTYSNMSTIVTSSILSKKLIFIVNCSICYLYFIVAEETWFYHIFLSISKFHLHLVLLLTIAWHWIAIYVLMCR